MVRYLPDGEVRIRLRRTTGSSRPRSLARATGPTRSRCNPMARSSWPGSPLRRRGSTATSRWLATNRTETLDTSSTVTGSSRPIWARSQDDDALARSSIQPDGRIIVAGTAGEDIARGALHARRQARHRLRQRRDAGSPTWVRRRRHRRHAHPRGQDRHWPATRSAPSSTTTSCSRATTPTAPSTPGSAPAGPSRPTSAAPTTCPRSSTIDAAGQAHRRRDESTSPASPTFTDMVLARYHPDGTPDTRFATNGILTADFHGRGDFGQDVALDAARQDRRRRVDRRRLRHRVRADASQP